MIRLEGPHTSKHIPEGWAITALPSDDPHAITLSLDHKKTVCLDLDATFYWNYRLSAVYRDGEGRCLFRISKGTHGPQHFRVTPHEGEVRCGLFLETSTDDDLTDSGPHIVLRNFRMSRSFPVDAVYYINLAHRPARRRHICKELETMRVPSSIIHRVDAVYIPSSPQIGCARSHMKAISDAAKKGHDRVLILEDDFQFKCSPSEFTSRFARLDQYDPDWDVAMLSTVHRRTHPIKGYPGILRVEKADTTAGYVLQAAAYMPLFSVFRNCSVPHPMAAANQYAIDVAWQVLQPRMQWYLCEMGSQTEEFPSDIEIARTGVSQPFQ